MKRQTAVKPWALLCGQNSPVPRAPIRNGVPIVGLEPSCMTVFREELPNLFSGDEDAKRLAGQSFILSEFLEEKVKDYRPPTLRRKALVHGHCHHKSILHFETEVDLLKKAGIDCDVPDSGCCGMAESFGYEAGHYKVGLDCGERFLLPAVRSASRDELIITDGFSCREMIRQETDRRALHFAQVLQMAHDEGPTGRVARCPKPVTLPSNERRRSRPRSWEPVLPRAWGFGGRCGGVERSGEDSACPNGYGRVFRVGNLTGDTAGGLLCQKGGDEYCGGNAEQNSSSAKAHGVFPPCS